MIKTKYIIIVLYSILTSFNSFIYPQNTQDCSNWINTDYINCLKNKLPCECEKEVVSYFIIKLDTIKLSILLLKYVDLEEEQYNIRKVSDSSYNVITINEVNNKCIGKIFINDQRLYYIDDSNEKLVFDYFGVSNFGNTVDDSKFNIELLNKAFLNRGYLNLEKIVQYDSLACYCNKWKGKINFLYSLGEPQSWILEIKNDSLFINTVTYPNEDPDPDDTIIPKKFKAYKWR